MEIKATVSLVLASLLLVTTWFSTPVEAVLPVCSLYPPSRCHPSLEEVDTEAMAPPPEERPHSHPLIKAPPAHSPEKPQAPCPPPENHHYHHAPGKAPFHSPEKHHYHHAPKYECPSRCEEHCKKDHHKKEEEEEGRRCVKACTACCCESKRVPEHETKCKWSHMKMEDKKMKCP